MTAEDHVAPQQPHNDMSLPLGVVAELLGAPHILVYRGRTHHFGLSELLIRACSREFPDLVFTYRWGETAFGEVGRVRASGGVVQEVWSTGEYWGCLCCPGDCDCDSECGCVTGEPESCECEECMDVEHDYLDDYHGEFRSVWLGEW